MRYVTDHFSLEMIKDPTYTIIQKTLKRQAFMDCIIKARSSITSGKIAYMLHKKARNQTIELRKGDEIYIVTSKFGRNHSCEYTRSNGFRFEVFTIN